MDPLDGFSTIFHKGDLFDGFLFALLCIIPFSKAVYSKEKHFVLK